MVQDTSVVDTDCRSDPGELSADDGIRTAETTAVDTKVWLHNELIDLNT